MLITIGIIIVFVGIALASVAEELPDTNKVRIVTGVLSVLFVIAGFAITCGTAYEKLKTFELPSGNWTPQYSQPDNTAQEEKGHCSVLAKSCIVDEWSPVCLLKECIVDTRE